MKKLHFLVQLFSFLLISGISVSAKAQIITTVVDTTGVSGWGGDGGSGATALISQPTAVFIDGSGNLYISDNTYNRIRKVSPTGTITTIAGNGTAGSAGDGGPATLAELNSPMELYVDNSGNVYVADAFNNRVRKISATGMIYTIAGNGTAGETGDGGPATAAELNRVMGIVIDNFGNLYIADELGNRIRKVNTSGIISTFAGNGIGGFTLDGIPATAAEIYNPVDLIVDASNNIYFSDNGNQRIRKINTSGIISTVAGIGGAPGFSGDGGPATAARLSWPGGAKIDPAGNIFFTDCFNYRCREIVASSGIIKTFAGTGTSAYCCDHGPATAAELTLIHDVAIDAHGNVYLADGDNNRIRYVIFNTWPEFVSGDTQTLTICSAESRFYFDSLSAITDSIAGLRVSWTLTTPPSHGTAAVSYNTTSTGGTLTTTGLTYTPTTGYAGSDLFRFSVSDEISTIIKTINVTINPLPNAGIVSGTDSVCPGDTVFLTDTASGGTWTTSDGSIATVTAGGRVNGVSPGRDTIIYTDSNACGSASYYFPFKVRSYAACNTSVQPTPPLNSGEFTVYPNPNTGTFTLSINSNTAPDAYIVIADLLGRKVDEFKIPTNKPTDINLNSASSGVYFIMATTANSCNSEKIIISK